MSETATAISAEVLPTPERSRHIPTSEFSARVLIGATNKEALNHTQPLTEVKSADLGSFEGRDYSLFDERSKEERAKKWEDKAGIGFDQQMKDWTDRSVQNFTNAKEFFTTGERGKRWAEMYKGLVLDVENPNPEQLQAMYQKYFSPDGAGIKQFVGDMLKDPKFQKLDGSMDIDRIEKDLDGIQWLSKMFGKNSAEVITRLVHAEAQVKNDPTKLALKVEADRDKAMPDEEKQLLNFLRGETTPIIDSKNSNQKLSPEQTQEHNELRRSQQLLKLAQIRKRGQQVDAQGSYKELNDLIDQRLAAGESIDDIIKTAAAELRGKFSRTTVTVANPEIPKNVVAKVHPQYIEKLLNEYLQMELTRELMQTPDFRPTEMIKTGDEIFYAGAVIKNGDRDQAIMYYFDQKNNRLIPRVFYKSNSDGGWRSCPGYLSQYHIYSKGNNIHYTQETKPSAELVNYLESQSDLNNVVHFRGDALKKYFDIPKDAPKPEWYSFDNECKEFDDKGVLAKFQKFPPGHYSERALAKHLDYDTMYDLMQDGKYPLDQDFSKFNFDTLELKKFKPDFSKTPEAGITKHTLLGDVNTMSFSAELNGRPVKWTFAYDKDGRVWVDRIVFTDADVNSYGVPAEVIDSGALTNKPIEYRKQVDGITSENYKKFGQGDTYVDITPLLNNIPLIQEFRAKFNIPYEVDKPQSAAKVEYKKGETVTLSKEEIDLYRKYMSYVDLNGDKSDNEFVQDLEKNNKFGKYYVKEFKSMMDEYGKDLLIAQASANIDEVKKVLQRLGLPPEKHTVNISWFMWDAAKSRFLANNPDAQIELANSAEYQPFDPMVQFKVGTSLEDIKKSQDAMEANQNTIIGWDIFVKAQRGVNMLDRLKGDTPADIRDQAKALLEGPTNANRSLSSYKLRQLGEIFRQYT